MSAGQPLVRGKGWGRARRRNARARGRQAWVSEPGRADRSAQRRSHTPVPKDGSGRAVGSLWRRPRQRPGHDRERLSRGPVSFAGGRRIPALSPVRADRPPRAAPRGSCAASGRSRPGSASTRCTRARRRPARTRRCTARRRRRDRSGTAGTCSARETRLAPDGYRTRREPSIAARAPVRRARDHAPGSARTTRGADTAGGLSDRSGPRPSLRARARRRSVRRPRSDSVRPARGRRRRWRHRS